MENSCAPGSVPQPHSHLLDVIYCHAHLLTRGLLATPVSEEGSDSNLIP